MGLGLAHESPAGRDFGLFWNQTEQFFLTKPGPLAGYLGLLLTLYTGIIVVHMVCTL
jgi:hypothetical protein